MEARPPSIDVVVPTTGRPSLYRLLGALAVAHGPLPERLLLVHDRKDGGARLALERCPARLAPRVETLRGAGTGPAAARNLGWRASSAEWVSFLDDDVVPAVDWPARLVDDLAGLGDGVAGSQGRLEVPLARDRQPTDWERNVKNLEGARWATADMAYRRSALERVGGFDERFRRAYREDADLALRMAAAGYRLVRGSRLVTHPVGPADRWVSVRLQAGNADDVLMDALHGRGWRAAAGGAEGRFRRHVGTTVAGALALGGLAAGRRRVAASAAAAWVAGTVELAWARIAPGPRTADELATMVATSILIPPAATLYRLAGHLRKRRLLSPP